MTGRDLANEDGGKRVCLGFFACMVWFSILHSEEDACFSVLLRLWTFSMTDCAGERTCSKNWILLLKA